MCPQAVYEVSMKRIPENERDILFEIKLQSKLGRRLTDAEMERCMAAHLRYREDYGLLDAEVQQAAAEWVNPLARKA